MAYAVDCNFSATADFNRDLAFLEEQWRTEGLYDGDPWAVLGQALLVAGLLATSAKISHRFPVLGGGLVGLVVLVCLKITHQLGHRAGLFSNNALPSEDLRFGLEFLIGNIGCGLDVGWWQSEHAPHHRFTNSRLDPQMPTAMGHVLPVMAWEESALTSFLQEHSRLGFYLRFQELLWVPILLTIGKIFPSIFATIRLDGPTITNRLVRRYGVLGHFVLLLTMAWCWVPSRTEKEPHSKRCSKARRWLFSAWVVGTLIQPMFYLNHIQTGVSPTTEADHKLAQLCHTIGYTTYLPGEGHFIPVDYHVEHHIAPKMPDEHLHIIAPQIKQLALKYGLPYEQRPLVHEIWKHTVKLANVPRDRVPGLVMLVVLALLASGSVRRLFDSGSVLLKRLGGSHICKLE